MTLVDMANLAQVIGAIGVVASLIFVGIQIRQNTAATRAASHNAVSDSLNDFNRMFAESMDLSQIWLAGTADRGALTDVARFRFDAAARAYMHVCEPIDAGCGRQGHPAGGGRGYTDALCRTGLQGVVGRKPLRFLRRIPPLCRDDRAGSGITRTR